MMYLEKVHDVLRHVHHIVFKKNVFYVFGVVHSVIFGNTPFSLKYVNIFFRKIEQLFKIAGTNYICANIFVLRISDFFFTFYIFLYVGIFYALGFFLLVHTSCGVIFLNNNVVCTL